MRPASSPGSDPSAAKEPEKAIFPALSARFPTFLTEWAKRLRLEVQRPAVSREHALVHHFAQRRVREYRFDQLRLGGFELLGDGVTLDQLGHFRADHVGAEKLAGLGVEHRLHEAFRLAER